MNDANEIKTGVTAFRAACESMEDKLTEDDMAVLAESGLLESEGRFDLFLVSASEEPDLLTLWRGYGGGQVAYALGFDRTVALVPREQKSGEHHPAPPPDYYGPVVDEEDGFPVFGEFPDDIDRYGGGWGAVTYIERESNDKAVAYIHDFLDAVRLSAPKEWPADDYLQPSVRPAVFLKDRGFQDERETRIVVEARPAWKFVLHRDSRFGLVPYVELVSAVGNLLPIRKVMIGPSPDPEAAQQSLRMFLDNAGYGEVSIESSEIPYR